ncbi:MAG: MATE family efflux transporter [Ignavibacteriae bacterium]|nr:MAG: MATE family efflux transporter [Ignavibacteriota bacterium]
MPSENKKLNKEIIRLAWPAVLQTVVRSSIPIIDSYWVGHLGSEQLAAITVGSFLSWGVFAIGSMLPVGTNSLIAQATGAKQPDTSRQIGAMNLIAALFFGLLIAAVIMPLLPVLYSLTNLDAPKSILANQYLFVLLLGFPSMLLFETGNSIFRGTGDTQTPFRLLVVAVIMKVTLTPLLIFGIDGNLQWGMSGASGSTIISYSITFFIGFYLLRKRSLIMPIKNKLKTVFKDITNNWKIIKQTIKIGIPISLEGLFFSMIYIFVSRFVSDFGTVGLAALGIGHRSEAVPYMVGEGFSVTASILVGQNIGANNPERGEKAAWKVFYLACIPMVAISFVLFFGASNVAGFFTTDIDVIEVAKVYNTIAAFSIFFAAAESVFTGAFAGAGNSVPPLLISLPITALRIPLCAIFAPIYGMNGIWIAIFSTSILKGLIVALWFRRGKWKEKKFELGKKGTTEYIEDKREILGMEDRE